MRLLQLLSYPHVDEVAILSTCNRLEIYIVSQETLRGLHEVTQFLSEHSKLPIMSLRHHLFMLLHADACHPYFTGSAGLDSLVLGEGQILAQVKNTHKLGQQFNGIKTILNRLFKQALTAGKRVSHRNQYWDWCGFYQFGCCGIGTDESRQFIYISCIDLGVGKCPGYLYNT